MSQTDEVLVQNKNSAQKKLVYVAGPYRALNAWKVERNVRRAEEMTYEVWKCGAVGVCPHTNTRFMSGALGEQHVINGYLELLRRCDAVVVCGDWRNSEGTMKEIEVAGGEGIPVFYTLHELRSWLFRRL